MKKLSAVIFLLALSACGLNYQNMPTFDTEMKKSMSECNKRLVSKEFSKESEMLEKCQKPNNIAIFERFYGTSNSDVMIASEDKNIELTKKLEQGKITQEEKDKAMEESNKKQFAILEKRQEAERKKEIEIAKKQEAERRKEEARLAKYYKEHPEVLIQQQQLQIQQQQLQAMQQQNALAEQQMRSNAFIQLQQLNLQQQQLQQQQNQQIYQQPVFQVPQRQSINCQSYVLGNYLNTNCN